jgi:hypothetical protein
MSKLRELYAEKAAPAQKAAPAWSWSGATLNAPYLIAIVLFCLFCLISLFLETSGHVAAGS